MGSGTLHSRGLVTVEVALNEATSKAQNPNVPIGSDEVIADALECVAAGATAVHFHGTHASNSSNSAGGDANIAALRSLPSLHDVVLVGVVRREQGLVVARGNPRKLYSLQNVLGSGAKMAVRQAGAGSQLLLEALLKRAGINLKDLHQLAPPSLTGPDLASAIRTGSADCGIATRGAARAAGLDFVPLAWESFDLLMRQRSYFCPAIQALIGFLRGKRFVVYAGEERVAKS